MRSYVLIAYDITNHRRLHKVHKLVRGYGDPIQYSVFLAQLSQKDLVVLREKLKDIIFQKEDKVVIIILGSVDSNPKSVPENWTILGKKQIIRDFSVIIY